MPRSCVSTITNAFQETPRGSHLQLTASSAMAWAAYPPNRLPFRAVSLVSCPPAARQPRALQSRRLLGHVRKSLHIVSTSNAAAPEAPHGVAQCDRPSGWIGYERQWPVTYATRCLRLCDPGAAGVRDHTSTH